MAPSSSSFDLGGPHDASLHCSQVKREALTDVSYWRQLCPELTIGEAGSANCQPFKLPHSAGLRQQVDSEGVCLVHADELPWQGVDFEVLAKCVVRLMDHGWPASFLIMYDQVWQLVEQIGGVMEEVTGNAINFDILAWYIHPSYGHVGFSPHRDRQPTDVAASFRSDGSAKYTTAWIPFLDACPENSCLYMLPRWADPGYIAGDADDGPDPLQVALASKESYQAIRALPAEPGAAVIFTHRIIHWGSKGRKGYPTPRISLSFGCADDSFEPAYLDRSKVLPYPSVQLRAALICAQMIVYHERFDLTPRQLNMFKKVFMSEADEFHKTYRAKVLEEFVAATKDVSQRQQGPTQQPPAVDNGQPGEAADDVAPDSSKAAANGASEGAKGVVKSKGKAEKAGAGRGDQVNGTGADAKGKGKDKDQGKGKGKSERKETSSKEASKKHSKKKEQAVVVSEEEEEEEEEEEGPGFDLGEGGDSDDVDLLDDALDAMLEARLEGLDYQDDFSSDMAASEDEGGDDDDDADADEDADEDGKQAQKKKAASSKKRGGKPDAKTIKSSSDKKDSKQAGSKAGASKKRPAANSTPDKAKGGVAKKKARGK